MPRWRANPRGGLAADPPGRPAGPRVPRPRRMMKSRDAWSNFGDVIAPLMTSLRRPAGGALAVVLFSFTLSPVVPFQCVRPDGTARVEWGFAREDQGPDLPGHGDEGCASRSCDQGSPPPPCKDQRIGGGYAGLASSTAPATGPLLHAALPAMIPARVSTHHRVSQPAPAKVRAAPPPPHHRGSAIALLI